METGTRAMGAGGSLPAQNKGCGGGAQRGRGRASLALRRERWGRGGPKSGPAAEGLGAGFCQQPHPCARGGYEAGTPPPSSAGPCIARDGRVRCQEFSSQA